MNDEQTVEIKVCGGFTVLVTFTTCPAEPDVGIPYSYGEVQIISTSNGKPCPWLEKKFTDADQEAIDMAIWEKLHG